MATDIPAKALAGVLLGAPLSFFLCGLYGYLGPGSLQDNYFVVLFLLLPAWTGLIALALASRSGVRAWAGLALANAAGFGLLSALRQWLH